MLLVEIEDLGPVPVRLTFGVTRFGSHGRAPGHGKHVFRTPKLREIFRAILGSETRVSNSPLCSKSNHSRLP